MNDTDDDAGTGVPGAGLCNGCTWQRVVTSARGSAFSMCRLSAQDRRFRKYPPLPVLACDGFEPRAVQTDPDAPEAPDRAGNDA